MRAAVRPPAHALVLAMVLTSACALAPAGSTGSAGPASGDGRTGASAIATVDESKSAGTLPADYLGLSYEARQLAAGGLDPAHGNLAALLRTLGTGNLRIGGNTVDRDVFWQSDGQPVPAWASAVLGPAQIERLGALAGDTRWKVELAVNLGHLDAASIASEAGVAAADLGPQLQALECGNEPNDYRSNGLRNATYDYAQYRADFETCAGAIGSAARIAGPDTTGAFIPQFAGDEGSRLSMLTQHLYPLSNCGSSKPTLQDLLSPATDAREVSKVAPALAAARKAGLPLRLDEMNSASCGGLPGVSDTLGAALWGVDAMLLLAEQGVAGVSFHGGLGQCDLVVNGKINVYTPLCAASAADLRAGIMTPQPIFYSLLLVHLLGPGELMPVSVTGAGNVTGYAVRGGDGRTRVLLVDRDETGRTVPVRLQAGLLGGEATVLCLTGRSLGSGEGVAIQGARVDRSGGFQPGTAGRAGGSRGTWNLSLRSGSATLITLPRALS